VLKDQTSRDESGVKVGELCLVFLLHWSSPASAHPSWHTTSHLVRTLAGPGISFKSLLVLIEIVNQSTNLGFLTVSSTLSKRHVASEAAVIALAFTIAGSLLQET